MFGGWEFRRFEVGLMMQVIWRIPIRTNWAPDGIPIYGFGLMLFFAFILCTWLAGKRGEREGIRKETIQDLAIWIFLGGLLGARTTYLLQEPHPFAGGVWEFIKRLPRIWDGGIILYGSILGGLAGYAIAWLFIYRKQGLSTRRLADAVAPSIALGLALGRLGCFLNGCCYGQVACADCVVYPVTFPMSAPPREILVDQGYQTAAGFTLAPSLPQGVKEGAQVRQVDPDSPAWAAGLRPGSIIVAVFHGEGKDEKRLPVIHAADLTTYFSLGTGEKNWPRGQSKLKLEYLPEAGAEPVVVTFTPRTLGLYPTQLYEVVSMALLFLLLLAYYPFRRNPGQVMAVLMIGYGIHRYLNEILRDDPRPKDLESIGSYVCVAIGVVLWLWLWRKAPDPPVTLAPPAAGTGARAGAPPAPA
jgi:prolipoprotein diacylglyceryltransferase